MSALDIVPGGVIPASKPVRRTWYSTAQFRAAAAVLFVAGASFLLARNTGDESLPAVAERVAAEQSAAAAMKAEADAPEARVSQRAEPMAATGSAANKAETRQVPSSPVERRREASDLAASAPAPAAVAVDAPLSPPPPPSSSGTRGSTVISA